MKRAVIRKAQVKDAESIAGLLKELGYPNHRFLPKPS
jgi:N-acetylglutamate synthase-like GNAT family acetyltransferase